MNIFFLLMVEHHSFGVALTTPSKMKYWPAVSFVLKIFSLPRKKVSLDTKSPTLPIPHVSWKKTRYKDLPLLRMYLLFHTSWFIISSWEHASFPVRVDLASKRLCEKRTIHFFVLNFDTLNLSLCWTLHAVTSRLRMNKRGNKGRDPFVSPPLPPQSSVNTEIIAINYQI